MSEADRSALAACLRRREILRGEIVFREGDVGDAMFIIEQGGVRVLAREPSRAQRTVVDLGPGELFGEMACIDPAARSATALAVHDTSALVLNRDALHALRAHCPSPAQAVFSLAARSLARRLGEVHARLVARVGAVARASSGVVPRVGVEAPPAPVSARVAGWFRRGGA